MKRANARQERGDEGIALVVAISLIGLVTTLMLVMLAYALRETGSSGRDRQRASAVTAAEGQVDLTLSQLQNVSRTSLPCGLLSAVTSQQSPADTISVVTTVTYYDADGDPVPCSSVETAALAQAKVVAVASSNPLAGQASARRTFEALVNLSASMSNDLDMAIFGEAGVVIGNSATVLGEQGRPDADIYSNGDIVCGNSGTFNGSLLAQGSITVQESCLLQVDAHANDSVDLQNSVAVMGRVLVHAGDAILGNSISIGQQVFASGLIKGNCSPAAKCFPHATVPPVPDSPFPVISWDASEWPGYTIVTDKNDCDPASDANPSTWIRENGGSLTRGKTVVVTDCQIRFDNSVTVGLSTDLAIFARGGFDFGNSVTFSSSTAQALHLIQPYDSVATHPCTTDGVVIRNSVTVGGTVAALLYSPCNINIINSGTWRGQIYAGGTAQIKNSLTLHYRPVPLFGVTGTNQTSYSLDVVHKRENR